MKLLAIESSFEACSAALWLNGASQERLAPGPKDHAGHLLPFVQDLLDEAGIALGSLDGIAYSRGPGSFTSLRIGIGVVQGLAWGADLPVVGVSSLRCVAQAVAREGVERAWVAMDARMNEVFSACFTLKDGLMHESGEERVCAPASAIPADPSLWSGVGNAFERFEVLSTLPVHDRWTGATARAVNIARLALADFEQGLAQAADQAQPVYLRNQVAQKPPPG